MVRVIREMVTVTPEHEVRLQDSSIPAGSRVEVLVLVDSTQGEDSSVKEGSIWDVVGRAAQPRDGKQIVDEVRAERDAWEAK